MVRKAAPAMLTAGPFTLHDALRAGLTWKQLQSGSWRRIGHGRYLATALEGSCDLNLLSLQHRLPLGAAFSGRTAAWLHGLDFGPGQPIEATIPRGRGTWSLAGVLVSQASLADSDLCVRRGMPTTTALRTVFDLGRRPPFVEAVVAVDMALHSRLVGHGELRQLADTRTGSRGIGQFRRVLDLAEPGTESPMETRLRILLVTQGLPRPAVQVSVRDDNGRFLGRADLFYPEHRLLLEYDGGTHRTSLVQDDRRQNLLINAGFRILRFTFADVHGTPDSVVNQVRAALRR